MIKDLAEAIKTFTPQQWGVVATIIAGCITGWLWLNNRFAQKDTTDLVLNHVISIDSKISAIINTQYTEDQKKAIEKSAAEFERIMRLYHQSKNN